MCCRESTERLNSAGFHSIYCLKSRNSSNQLTDLTLNDVYHTHHSTDRSVICNDGVLDIPSIAIGGRDLKPQCQGTD